MRFHIGFSKRISVKTLIEILGLLFVGLMAFLGLSEHAYAETNGTASFIPNAMYFHTNSSGSDVSPTSFGSKTCSFDSSKTCFYMYGFNVNAFSPQDFNFIYNAKNICSNNNNLSTITFRGIMQSPTGTNVRGNLQAYQSNSSLANVSMEFQSNNVFTITIKYDTSKQLRLRFNSSLSDSSIYYMELTNNNYYTCDYTIQDSTQDITNNANQNTENIINNNNQNTNSIINNQNQNTQDIIDNQNANNQALIDSQKTCSSITYSNDVLLNKGWLNSSGVVNSASLTYVSEYIEMNGESTLNVGYSDPNNSYCLYNSDKTIKECHPYNNQTTINISYNGLIRYSGRLNTTTFVSKKCVKDSTIINDSITNSDISGASSTGNSFFDNFHIDDQLGLTSIITAPIRLLQTMVNSNDSCQALNLNLDLGSNYQKTVSIPGGCVLWDNVPSSVEALYFAVVFGLFGYRILIDMYHYLSSLRDPDKKNEFYLDL